MKASASPIRLGILGSGRGSNFVAIWNNIKNGALNASVEIVLSDKQSAMLEKATEFGLKSDRVDPSLFSSREAYDLDLVSRLKEMNVDIVILAGYMRLVSASFVHAFDQKILNIHPSLLPSFKGLHAQRQAIEAGVKVSGCTVHFVNEELDAGSIILQKAVSVEEGDTEDLLSIRILAEEHNLYSEAIQWVIENKF